MRYHVDARFDGNVETCYVSGMRENQLIAAVRLSDSRTGNREWHRDNLRTRHVGSGEELDDVRSARLLSPNHGPRLAGRHRL